MALTPIGNVTYINQNSQLGSIQHANATHRADVALNANMQEFVDKLKAVQEVSPAPEIHAIDPDDKQEKKRDFEEEQQEDKQKEEEQNHEAEAIIEADEYDIVCAKENAHLLDIRA